MEYMVGLITKNGWEHYKDYMLDGIVPDHVLPLTSVKAAKELGLCHNCEVASKCHVMIEGKPDFYEKYCPILFVDVYKPKWTIEDLV